MPNNMSARLILRSAREHVRSSSPRVPRSHTLFNVLHVNRAWYTLHCVKSSRYPNMKLAMTDTTVRSDTG